MKGIRVYQEIQQLKEMGFSRRNIARQLNISRDTVKKYWTMDADEYQQKSGEVRKLSALEAHKDVVLYWLKKYPDMTSAQVGDWLAEQYGCPSSPRTVSRFVKELRERYHIAKHGNKREYVAVEELPPGQQMQVDFGEDYMELPGGGRIKIHFAAFVLAHSRQKYLWFLETPFTAADLVTACESAFRYYGGMTKELVFDQDSVVCVSENSGTIIHTYEFERFRQAYGFRVYMCRKSDPESKGKIESVVKYVKGNFMAHRIYPEDICIFNQCALDWLDRTGNRKVHGSTKRPPVELFEIEREHLLPIPEIPGTPPATMRRTVRKDNTIIYQSNRYSVPPDTYNNHKDVEIHVQEDRLFIQTLFGDDICNHALSTGRGQLISNASHRRDRTRELDESEQQLNARLEGEACDYVADIRSSMPRYTTDQFRLLNHLIDAHGTKAVIEAIRRCQWAGLISATYVRDLLEHPLYPDKPQEKGDDGSQDAIPSLPVPPSPIPVSDPKYHIRAQKRPIEVYAKVGRTT